MEEERTGKLERERERPGVRNGGLVTMKVEKEEDRVTRKVVSFNKLLNLVRSEVTEGGPWPCRTLSNEPLKPL